MTLQEISDAVEYRLQIDLKSKLRDREHADGRALYYKISKEFTHHTFYSIGRHVDRDHSTVIHGINNVFMHVDMEIYELIKSDLARGEIPRKFFTSVIRQRNDNINVTKTI